MSALYVLTIFNIIMLLLNVWLRFDSEKTLVKLKESLGDSKDETS